MTESDAPSVTNRVVVTDIQMSMLSMVAFMVKWAIATIPAVLILFVVGMFLAGMVMSMAGGLP